MMKLLAILICTSLQLGCAGSIPLAELEAEALHSGDWSAVDRRERLRARHERHDIPRCPRGAAAVCDGGVEAGDCRCVSRAALQSIFTGRPW
jgi:hypothetical protein